MKKQPDTLVFYNEPFAAFAVMIMFGMLALISGYVWWITFLDIPESLFSTKNISALLTILFSLVSFRCYQLMRKPIPKIIFDPEGIRINYLYLFFGTVQFRWKEIDSAPQVRQCLLAGRGPVSEMLYLHFYDGRWEGIPDGAVSVSLEDLQVNVLSFLDKYGELSLRTARPVSEPPQIGTSSALGRNATPTSPEFYAIRFVIKPPPLPAARAMQMCFPTVSEQKIQELLESAEQLYRAGDAEYARFDSGEISWDEAISNLSHDHPNFSKGACIQALDSYRLAYR